MSLCLCVVVVYVCVCVCVASSCALLLNYLVLVWVCRSLSRIRRHTSGKDTHCRTIHRSVELLASSIRTSALDLLVVRLWASELYKLSVCMLMTAMPEFVHRRTV